MIVFIAFNRLYLSMGRYWNERVLYSWFSPINSSHRYSTRPNYRSTPSYPTKTKTCVPLSLFVALRLFSRADSRSGVHITIVFPKWQKMCSVSTIWRKMCSVSFFLIIVVGVPETPTYFSSFWLQVRFKINERELVIKREETRGRGPRRAKSVQ